MGRGIVIDLRKLGEGCIPSGDGAAPRWAPGLQIRGFPKDFALMCTCHWWVMLA